jgi:L-threonylcarbamoyladenylate synthase
MAADHDLHFSREADALAEAFWPGPITLILPGGGKLPDLLRGPEGGIAVRWTSHQGMADLIGFLGEPITSTSANRPRGRTAPGVGAIVEAFAEAASRGELLILDGGVLGNVPPSTLVDCTGNVPRLVRDGAIPRDELLTCVGGLAS